ncbi:MAG: MmcQ/YjbR family DNA-binding protein [Nannocystis sp.]|uniref:MmcQ/YjbR family DNA-binding protein n=1 Tax=Nannocystis sp. TaxID=1962667 RepID=UPI0024256C7E|nr:MmcQ/YjbR family DNA-binding protein [Nannocystis sp.]MBK9753408.1 MmcQ/YjbR family DNA-binding protein [Nannocystis sp.]
MANQDHIQSNAAALRAMAMSYPGAYEEFPWGEVAVKVNGKAFMFMHAGGGQLSMSCKLPRSHEVAQMLPFASPTGYGLGKSGWVTSRFGPRDEAPLELLREWVDESYRAIAPKKLVAELGASGQGAGGVKKVAKVAKVAVKKKVVKVAVKKKVVKVAVKKKVAKVAVKKKVVKKKVAKVAVKKKAAVKKKVAKAVRRG